MPKMWKVSNQRWDRGEIVELEVIRSTPAMVVAQPPASSILKAPRRLRRVTEGYRIFEDERKAVDYAKDLLIAHVIGLEGQLKESKERLSALRRRSIGSDAVIL